MPNCKLCQKAEATQTGSHITSSFFVKSQIGSRGNEVAFILTTDPNQDYTENVGAAPILEDNILCIGCERRISVLEDIISREYSNKIFKDAYRDNFNIQESDNWDQLILLKVEPIVTMLFIYSIIFRMHITSTGLYKDFKVSEELNEKLRFQLDGLMPEFSPEDYTIIEKQKEWIKTVAASHDLFDPIGLAIFRPSENVDDSANMDCYDTRNTSPYQFLLNDHIFVFADSDQNLNVEASKDFYKLNLEDLEPYKFSPSTPYLNIIPDEEWKRINADLVDKVMTVRATVASNQCKIELLGTLNRVPKDEELHECVRLKMIQFLKSMKK
jgi:hypothetical protein